MSVFFSIMTAFYSLTQKRTDLFLANFSTSTLSHASEGKEIRCKKAIPVGAMLPS